MSKEWKSEVLQFVPDYAHLLGDADIDSVGAFWLEVYFDFTRNDDAILLQANKISSIFNLVHEHLNSNDLDRRSAVALNFLEDLICRQWVQENIHNWISCEDFKEVDTIFERQLSHENFIRLCESFN